MAQTDEVGTRAPLLDQQGDSPIDASTYAALCEDGVRESAPSAQLPASAPKPPHAEYADRFADGTVRPGHPGPALKHGARSVLVAAGALPSQADAVALMQARQAAIVRDLGGDDVISALLGGQVERHVKLELVEATLWANLQAHGTLTGKGATRAAANLWLQVVDRIQKSAAAMGLERRARKVGTVAELLR